MIFFKNKQSNQLRSGAVSNNQGTTCAFSRLDNALSSNDCDEEDVDSTCSDLFTNNHKTDPNERYKSVQHVPIQQQPHHEDINMYKRQIEVLQKQVEQGAQCFFELNKLRENENKESSKYIVELQKLHDEKLATKNKQLLEVTKKKQVSILKKQYIALNALNNQEECQ